MLMLLESRVFSVYSLPFSSNACLELREQELVVEAVDRGDVGEDPCNDVLRDSSLCELSAKYLQGFKKKNTTYVYKNSSNFIPNTTKSGSYSWSRNVNKNVVVYPRKHIHFLLLWLPKCDQQLDMTQLKLN